LLQKAARWLPLRIEGTESQRDSRVVAREIRTVRSFQPVAGDALVRNELDRQERRCSAYDQSEGCKATRRRLLTQGPNNTQPNGYRTAQRADGTSDAGPTENDPDRQQPPILSLAPPIQPSPDPEQAPQHHDWLSEHHDRDEAKVV